MTEKRVVRVAAVQIAPDLDTAEGTLTRVLSAIAKAADQGAKLVVFPETFVPWYPYFAFVHPPVLTGPEHVRLYDNAVVVPGPGEVSLAGAQPRSRYVAAAGTVSLKIVPRSAKRRLLRRNGRLRLRLTVSFEPDGGMANSRSLTVRLQKTG